MTLECILDELKIIFKQINPNLDVDSVTLDTRLVEDLGLDSITILLLSFAIEKRFDFKFDVAKKFVNVGEAIGYIESRTE